MEEKLTAYEMIGGESGVKELVDRFYDIMDSDESLLKLRQMHAKSLKGSREKLFLFLSGWLGGPDVYVQRYGHPRLRARHMPFSIGIAERDQWMACMHRAMDEMGIEPSLYKTLSEALWKTADFMRNRAESNAMQGIPIRAEGVGQSSE